MHATLVLGLALAGCRSEPTQTARGMDSVLSMGEAMAAMNQARAQQERCAREASAPISLQQAMESDAAQARAALAQPVLRLASHEATRVLAELGRRTPRPQLPWKVLVVEGARATLTPLPMGTVVLTRAALRGLRDEAELAAVLGYAAVLIGNDRLDPSLAQQRQSACLSTALAATSDAGADAVSAQLAAGLTAQLPLAVEPAAQRAALALVAPLLREAGYAPRALLTVPEHAPALFSVAGQLPAAGEWSAAAQEALSTLGAAAPGGAVPALQPALTEAASTP